MARASASEVRVSIVSLLSGVGQSPEVLPGGWLPAALRRPACLTIFPVIAFHGAVPGARRLRGRLERRAVDRAGWWPVDHGGGWRWWGRAGLRYRVLRQHHGQPLQQARLVG